MRQALMLGLAATLALLHAPTVSGEDAPLLKLPPGSVQHELPASLTMNGIRMQARVLDIAGPMHEVLEDIALQFDPPLQALQHGDGWILAGTASEWLVMLSPRRHRTFAVVSSLSGRASALAMRTDLPGWLPAGVVQRMALQSEDQGRVSVQQVFTHPSFSSAQLASQVFAGLARAGWASSGAPRAASSTWIRGGKEISLSIVPAAGGSGILSVTTHPAASRPGSREHVLQR